MVTLYSELSLLLSSAQLAKSLLVLLTGKDRPDLQNTEEYQKWRFLVLIHRGGFLEPVPKGKLLTRSFGPVRNFLINRTLE